MTRSPLPTPKSCITAAIACTSSQHLRIGEFGDRAGQRRIVDQRHLIGAAARDVAVERVVAGVDLGAGEPAAVEPERAVEHLVGRLDPVDLAARPRPRTPRGRRASGHEPRDNGSCHGYSWRHAPMNFRRFVRHVQLLAAAGNPAFVPNQAGECRRCRWHSAGPVSSRPTVRRGNLSETRSDRRTGSIANLRSECCSRAFIAARRS